MADSSNFLFFMKRIIYDDTRHYAQKIHLVTFLSSPRLHATIRLNVKMYNFLVGMKIFAVPASYCERLDRLCLIGCEYFFHGFARTDAIFIHTRENKCRLHNKSY